MLSCNKDKVHQVQIRIINNTSTVASDVVMGGQVCGSVLPGQTTPYHYFNNLIVSPMLLFYNNQKPIEYTTGICGTPPPPYLDNGKYVYTITNDSSGQQGFGFTFTKE